MIIVYYYVIIIQEHENITKGAIFHYILKQY